MAKRIITDTRRLIAGAVITLFGTLFLTACVAKTSFFEQKQLVITPQGEVTINTTATDKDGNTVDVAEPVNVDISERADQPGQKVVEATFEMDMTVVPEGYNLSSWQLAFDRYTGISFEYYDPEGEQEQPSPVSFEYNGQQIEVQMGYSTEYDEETGILTVVIYVVCPEDYDGTVFQIGYSDPSIDEADADWPYSERLYTIDELPGFDSNGHEYFYFC